MGLSVAPLIAMGIASLGGASAYGFWLLPRPPSALRTVAKALAVGALAMLAGLSGHVWLLAAGLGLSALGDAFLAGEPRRWLPFGMAAFLLAEAAYIVVFLHAGGGVALVRQEPVRFAGALAAAASAVVAFRLILPRLGPMLGPALVYMLAILGTVFAALALPLVRWPAMAGAAAFLASDEILAVRLFNHGGAPNRSADLAVWWLYYFGQVGIAAAFIH